MRTTLDTDSFILRFMAAGVLLLAAAGLAACGNNNSAYSFDAPAAVAIADFSGTGYNGVAVAQAQINQLVTTEQPGYVAIIPQNPSSPGSFEASVHFATAGNPSAMAVGQFTPGSEDIAVANVNLGTISVLLQTSQNPLNYKPALTVPAGPQGATTQTLPEDVAICDVNNDGHPDLVVAYELNETISDVVTAVGGGVNVILQDPSHPGTFLAPTNVGSAPTPVVSGGSYEYPNSAFGVACANLSGDSTAPPDIVFTSFSEYDSNLLYNGGSVSIFFHDPANPGKFLPRVDLSVPGALHRVVIADVNNDGLPDIIVADESEDTAGTGGPGAVVILQEPPSSAGAQPNFLNASGTPNATTYTTDSAIALAVGDVNGDGYPDIVVVSSDPEGTGSVNILLNTASAPGTFSTTPTSLSALGNPVAVTMGCLQAKTCTIEDIALADGNYEGAGGAAAMLNEASDPGTFAAESLIGD